MGGENEAYILQCGNLLRTMLKFLSKTFFLLLDRKYLVRIA